MPTVNEHVDFHLLWGVPTDPVERVRFLAFALAGEAGELTGPIKKQWRGDRLDAVATRAKVIDELADVGNYAFMLARVLGIDLIAEMVAKFRTVETRPEFLRQMRLMVAEHPERLAYVRRFIPDFATEFTP